MLLSSFGPEKCDMMKKIWITCVLVFLAGMVAFAQTMSDGHSLTSLWKKYDAARKADRPQLEAEILAQIKQEAISRHLLVDFYDAATLYVSTVQRRDWKQRDALQKALDEEVSTFDEPIVTFQWMSRWKNASSDALWAYVQAHPDGFKGRTDAFYQDAGGYLGGALPSFIGNDHEYVLWRLLGSNHDGKLENSAVCQALLQEVEGRYPSQAALEYHMVRSRYYSQEQREERRQALGLLAQKYKGKAVSVFPKADLLRMRKEDLDKEKGAGSAYASLCASARTLEKERKAYTGTEATIADACPEADGLIRTLTASDVDVSLRDRRIRVQLRNLPQVTVNLRNGKKVLKTWKLKNTVGSFYVPDTLSVAMPGLADGDYTVEALNGKLSDQARYTQYTLSIASRTDSRGPSVYVADYDSGEPLPKVTLLLMKGDRQVAKTSLRLNGFTVLPSAFVKEMDERSYYEVVAVSGERKSRPVSLRMPREEQPAKSVVRCSIFKDQGAYHPGDTVRFKALVFEGEPSRSFAVCKDRVVEVRLRDSEGNQLASQKLVTNALGAASGCFVLPKGLRNGYFALEAEGLAYDSFRVDEFVLPGYEVIFDKLEEFFMAGDSIPVSGRLQSYSGHSLAGARVAVKVVRYRETVYEDVREADSNSHFRFDFPTRETGYYHATVTVTDFTGETRSFGKGYYVGDGLDISASVADAASVELEAFRNEEDRYYVPTYTLLQKTLRMTLQARDENGNEVPLPVRFQVLSADGGTLATGRPGKTVALRFDMDCNDVAEAADDKHRPAKAGFASEHKGCMHACGHDGHTSVGLGVAEILAKLQDRLTGKIKLIFQPAEEGVRGARAMAAKGVVDDADYLIGSHFMMPKVGFLAYDVQNFLATSKLNVDFTGLAAHAGGAPEQGKNALRAAAAAALNLHAITRHSAGSSRINVGVLKAGTGRNVVPATAHMEIETRGATTEINDFVRQRAEQVIKGAAQMYDVAVRITPMGSAPGGKNSPALAEKIRSTAARLGIFDEITDTYDMCGSEDFTYFMERMQKQGKQAAYIIVGGSLAAINHNDRFDFDEHAMVLSASLLAAAAVDLLQD